MNKKWLAVLCSLVVLAAGAAAMLINKPNEDDFVQWFSDNYEVDCLDDQCYTLQVASTDNVYWNAEGYYDSSTGFLNMGMQIKRLYRHKEDPNQLFSIEAEGFWGNFKEIDFQPNDVEVSRRE
ncbi:hypothetical protein [Rossellomorea sp. NS-SX7]|uniref:hypothetical protein n=1 Tax=Rossellomorea sp. NS-SX7 TaxID=3463856 RepID=UPI0040581360